MNKDNIILQLNKYVGCKIQLHQTRFSDELQDRSFTFMGIMNVLGRGNKKTYKLSTAELDFLIDVEFDYKGQIIDKLIVKPITEISDEEIIDIVVKCGFTKYSEYDVFRKNERIIVVKKGMNEISNIRFEIDLNGNAYLIVMNNFTPIDTETHLFINESLIRLRYDVKSNLLGNMTLIESGNGINLK